MRARWAAIGLAVLALGALAVHFEWFGADDAGVDEAGPNAPAPITIDPPEATEVGLEGHSAPAKDEGPADALPAPVDLSKADRAHDLHGIVVREDDTPVAGADIQVLSYPWRYDGVLTDGLYSKTEKGASTRSARDGTFSLRLRPGDQVHLVVRAEGLAPTEVTQLSAGERVRIVLQKGRALTVKVTAPSGAPAPGVYLRIFRTGMRSQTFEYEGVSNAEGICRFEGLLPVPNLYLDPRPQHEGWGDPGWVRVKLAAEGDTTFELKLVKGRTLRGRVTDAETGKPVAGARVGFNWVLHPEVKTDEDGRYVIHGWTGNGVRDVHVLAVGYGRMEALVGKRETLDFALVRGQRLYGRVVNPAGVPIAGARVSAVGSQRVSGNQETSFESGTTGADGRFEARSLRRDMPHDLVIFARGYARHLAVVAPDPGAEGIDLGDIALGPNRSLVGTVSNADGTPAARVSLELKFVGDGERGHRYTRSWDRMTDDLGRFRFDELPPALYELILSPRGAGNSHRDVTVIDDDEPTRLDVALDASRELRVHVVDDAGAPVSDVHVSIEGPAPRDHVGRSTDKDGRVKLRVKPGKLHLDVWFGNEAPYEAAPRRTVMPTDNDVRVVLKRAALTKGRLLGPDDKPVPWALLNVERAGAHVTNAYTDAEGRFTCRVGGSERVEIVFFGRAGKSAAQRFHWQTLALAGRREGVVPGTEDVVVRARSVEGGRAVTVRVVDPGGNALPKVRVTLDPLPEGVESLRETGADGQVTYDGLLALPTRVRVNFFSTREQPWRAPPSNRVTPDGQTEEIRLVTGSTIEGRLVEHDGTPITKGSVQVYVDGRSSGAGLVGKDGRFLVVVPFETNAEVELKRFGYKDGKSRSTAARALPGATDVELRMPK